MGKQIPYHGSLLMNILVTGAKGFLGNALIQELRKTDHYIVGTTRTLDENCRLFKCDLSDENDVIDLFGSFDFDIIYHLAANPLTNINQTGIERLWKDNVIATKNLLDLSKKGTKFIYASSVTVYSNESLKNEASEKHVPNPQSFYGFTKWTSERLIEEYSRQKGLEAVSARLCAVTGLGSTHGVIHDLYKKYKKSNNIEVIGAKPGTTKPFIHINDVVRFFKLWVDKSPDYAYNAYNVATSYSLSIAEICRVIKERLKIEGEETWTGNTWVGDNSAVKINNYKALNELDFYPEKDSIWAIQTTIQDYEENL